MNRLRSFLFDEDATTAVEYAVMIALIIAVLLGAISTLGGGTGALFGNIDSEMKTHGM